MSELKTKYNKEIVSALRKELNLKNDLAVPRISKITINVGIPKSDTSKQQVEAVKQDIIAITGQEPKIALAKKAIAGFNIRQGDPVGVAVTLRGEKMFDFLEKLCRIVLPQVKDFKGVKKTAFDGNGNYTLGLTEQIIFPEIDYAKVDKIRGMEISIITTATKDEHARKLLKAIGMPFEKEE